MAESLGRQHLPNEYTFDWFGTEIRAHPDVTDTMLADFMEQAEQLEADQDVVGAVKMTKQLVRDCIHPDDFDDYWALGRKHRQTIEDHMRVTQMVMQKAVQAETSRPTQPSAESSAGEKQTGESEGDFLKRVMPNRPEIRAGMYDELARKRAATG